VITIVDYGLGNIRAFSNLYKRMNIETRVAKTTTDFETATKIILPGVGAFDQAMQLLNGSGMRSELDRLVLEKKIPVLGVCVGMQILAQGSDEGSLPGLGWIPGRVRALRLVPDWPGLPLPHMGWNDVQPAAEAALFRGMENEAHFYFLHSFFFECARPEHTMATANYGIDFACTVQSGNIMGVQFHPEKSHSCGSRLLKNFAEA
jgi:imidazole glycerol-phosphate synthase subunit HisH